MPWSLLHFTPRTTLCPCPVAVSTLNLQLCKCASTDSLLFNCNYMCVTRCSVAAAGSVCERNIVGTTIAALHAFVSIHFISMCCAVPCQLLESYGMYAEQMHYIANWKITKLCIVSPHSGHSVQFLVLHNWRAQRRRRVTHSKLFVIYPKITLQKAACRMI